MTPQIDRLGKTSPVLRVSTHIYPVSKEIDVKTFIGLSFLFIEMTELCEARAKLEMSSNFQIYPGKTDDEPPPFETARALSELFTVQCHQ